MHPSFKLPGERLRFRYRRLVRWRRSTGSFPFSRPVNGPCLMACFFQLQIQLAHGLHASFFLLLFLLSAWQFLGSFGMSHSMCDDWSDVC